MDDEIKVEIEEMYKQYEKLIYSVSHKFHKKYGGEMKIILAEARYFFVEAFHSYFEADGSFSTWLHFTVWHGLLGNVCKHPKSIRCLESFDPKIHKPPVQKDFHLCDVLESLSEDGRKIVHLVFYPPDILQKKILETGAHPHNIRAGIKKFLYEELGWSSKQINNAFKEVKNIICSN